MKPRLLTTKEKEGIKKQLLSSAIKCPVCNSSVKQQIKFHSGMGANYHLTDCVCKGCGVRIAREKYPTETIFRSVYAIVKKGGRTFAVDAVGRVYEVILESKIATYMSGEMGRPGDEYHSGYTETTLHWIGLLDELWHNKLW